MDSGSSTAAFLVATSGTQVVCKSAPVHQSFDPTFNERFRFRDSAGRTLKLTLYNFSLQTEGDLIGHVLLDETSLADIAAQCRELRSGAMLRKTFHLKFAGYELVAHSGVAAKRERDRAAGHKHMPWVGDTSLYPVEGIDGLPATLTAAFRYVPRDAGIDFKSTQGYGY